jgi:ubiquinone/menaquinone biosynthesis C-methylase UbiE
MTVALANSTVTGMNGAPPTAAGSSHTLQWMPFDHILSGYICHGPISYSLHRAAELRQLLATEVQKPVLDVGCGGGEFAAVAFIGKPECGVDVDARRIRAAQRTGGHRDVLQADARFLPFTDGVFGTVVCISVFEHIADVDGVLQEVFRVLRPEGILLGTAVISDMHAHLFHATVLRAMRVHRLAELYCCFVDRVFEHRTLLSKDEWERRLRRTGFSLQLSRKVVSPRATMWFDALLPAAAVSRTLSAVLGRGFGFSPRRWPAPLFAAMQRLVAEEGQEGSNLCFVARKPA